MLQLEGARLVCPTTMLDVVGDLRVVDGKIVALGPSGSLGPLNPDFRRVDCRGLTVVPGFVELGAVFGEPGAPWREDLVTGQRAAAAGGFVRVLISPRTSPRMDRGGLAADLLARGGRLGLVHLGLAGALTVGLEGVELAELGALQAAGCIAFSDGGLPVADSGVLRRALEYARPFGLPVLLRPGEPSLEVDGVMHEGITSLRVGLRGIPEASEEVGLTRMIALARATGARVHLSHLTTPRAVSALVAARREGVAVSGAIPARHLLLTDEEVERRGYDSHLRLLPPLRPEGYRAALVEALREGLVEVASADHQPLTRVEKEHEFQAAEPGAVGLESAFSAVFTALSGDLLASLRALSSGPAAVLGQRAALEVGAPADLALLDLAWEGTIERPRWSRSDNEPLVGVPVRGKVIGTLLAGQPTLPLLQGSLGPAWA